MYFLFWPQALWGSSLFLFHKNDLHMNMNIMYMNIISDDFKPASVDTSQESQVEVGKGHHVTLTVPHVEVGRTYDQLRWGKIRVHMYHARI